MILLDLSAAFDTVDHSILINNLKEHYCFWDKALHWFEEYLRSCNFKVCIERKYSKPKPLDFSVPQGTCSSANILTCFLIGNIILHHTTINGFADDHSLRRIYKVPDKEHGIQSKSNLQSTFMNIQKWINEAETQLGQN